MPEIQRDPTVRSTMATSILGKYANILREINIKNKSITKRKSFAHVIDGINTKYFLKASLAVHSHSLYATKKIATMIIGKLKESEPSIISSPTSPISEHENHYGNDSESKKFRIKFRRYKLTSKSRANGSITHPVMKFTFTRVHQDDNNDFENRHHNLKFLPGHYIEVQSRIKGQVVIRSYTPVEGKIIKSFSIFVKIYPDGLMSQHLVRF